MNLEAEIKELKKRLERIESFCRGVEDYLKHGPHPSKNQNIQSTVTEGDPFELTDLSVRHIEDGGLTRFSWKLEIKNRSTSSLELHGNINFLDADGFLVDSSPTGLISIDGDDIITKVGTSLFKNEIASRIVDFEADLECFD